MTKMMFLAPHHQFLYGYSSNFFSMLNAAAMADGKTLTKNGAVMS